MTGSSFINGAGARVVRCYEYNNQPQRNMGAPCDTQTRTTICVGLSLVYEIAQPKDTADDSDSDNPTS